MDSPFRLQYIFSFIWYLSVHWEFVLYYECARCIKQIAGVQIKSLFHIFFSWTRKKQNKYCVFFVFNVYLLVYETVYTEYWVHAKMIHCTKLFIRFGQGDRDKKKRKLNTKHLIWLTYYVSIGNKTWITTQFATFCSLKHFIECLK